MIAILRRIQNLTARRSKPLGRLVFAKRRRNAPQVEPLESLCLLAPVTLGPFAASFAEQLVDNIPRQVTLPQFDPTLGTLLEVRILASDQIFGRFAVENLSNTSAESIRGRIMGQNTFTGPGLEGFTPANLADTSEPFSLAQQEQPFPTDPLFCGPDSLRYGVTPPPSFLPPEVPLEPCEPNDGTIIVDTPLEASESYATTITTASGLAPFLGTGLVTYSFNTQGEADILGNTGNLITLTLLSSAADIRIEYLYEPPPPEVVCVPIDAHIQGIHHQPTVVILTFGGPVDAVAASDPANYGLFRLATNGTIQARIPFQSVVFDAAANTVTLTPNPPLLPLGSDYLITASRRIAGSGPNDGFVNPDGADLPCVDFERVIRRGTHLHFRDVDGDGVTLGVSHGGLLEMHRTRDGQIRNLKIRSVYPPPRNLRPPHALFRGSVTRGAQGDGQVTIGNLIGTSQVRNQLPGSFRVLRETPEAPRLPAAQPGPLYQQLSRERLNFWRR